MKTLFKTLLLLAAIAYIIFSIGWLKKPTGETVCTGIVINIQDSTGNGFVSEEDILALLHNAKISVEGQAQQNIDLHAIDSQLSECPYIDTVSTYHAASGKLCIDIVPMHPVLHVITEHGDNYYVDQSGKIMPAGTQNADLCIVSGNITSNFAKTQLPALGTYLMHDDYWRDIIQQVNVINPQNIELIPSVGDHVIEIGDLSNLEEKFEHLRLFYEKGLPHSGWNKYSTISVAYKDQVVCKKKNVKNKTNNNIPS